MRCDQCRHWKKQIEPINDEFDSDWNWEAARAGFGLCQAIRAGWRVMDETRPRAGEETTEQFYARRIGALIQARAYVMDGSEYIAVIYTGPDFFCALYEGNGNV